MKPDHPIALLENHIAALRRRAKQCRHLATGMLVLGLAQAAIAAFHVQASFGFRWLAFWSAIAAAMLCRECENIAASNHEAAQRAEDFLNKYRAAQAVRAAHEAAKARA